MQHPANHRDLAEDCKTRFVPLDPLQGTQEHPLRNVEVALARKGVEPAVAPEVRLFREIRASEARQVCTRYPRWIPENQYWSREAQEYFVPVSPKKIGLAYLRIGNRVGAAEQILRPSHILGIDLEAE